MARNTHGPFINQSTKSDTLLDFLNNLNAIMAPCYSINWLRREGRVAVALHKRFESWHQANKLNKINK